MSSNIQTGCFLCLADIIILPILIWLIISNGVGVWEIATVEINGKINESNMALVEAETCNNILLHYQLVAEKLHRAILNNAL